MTRDEAGRESKISYYLKEGRCIILPDGGGLVFGPRSIFKMIFTGGQIKFTFRAAKTNTGPATLNVEGRGVKEIHPAKAEPTITPADLVVDSRPLPELDKNPEPSPSLKEMNKRGYFGGFYP